MCFIYDVKWWTFIAYKTVVCADLEGNQGGPYPPPPCKIYQKLYLEPLPPMANANNCRNPWIRAWVDVSIYHWVRSCKLVSVFKRRWLFGAWVFYCANLELGSGTSSLRLSSPYSNIWYNITIAWLHSIWRSVKCKED